MRMICTFGSDTLLLIFKLHSAGTKEIGLGQFFNHTLKFVIFVKEFSKENNIDAAFGTKDLS